MVHEYAHYSQNMKLADGKWKFIIETANIKFNDNVSAAAINILSQDGVTGYLNEITNAGILHIGVRNGNPLWRSGYNTGWGTLLPSRFNSKVNILLR